MFAASVTMSICFPVAVYLDPRALTEASLPRLARDEGAAIAAIRNFHVGDVVGRVLANPGTTLVRHIYRETSGQIPLRRSFRRNWAVRSAREARAT